jgi:hypothetical protein
MMSQNENKQKNESVNVRFTLGEFSRAAKKLNSEEFKQEVKNTVKKISNCNECEDDLAKQVADLIEQNETLKLQLSCGNDAFHEMHDHYKKHNEALKAAFSELLSASIEYIEYEHDGDPDKEDARSMSEMMLNELNEDGSIDKFKKLLKESE